MRPLAALGTNEARALRGLLFDLDDTVLDAGRLALETYGAMFALASAGLELVAVTGRPAAWAALLARQWPIAGAVAENGAVAFHREGARIVRTDGCGERERGRRGARLAEVVAAIREAVPDLRPADDAPGRATDFTFDIGETVRVADDTVRRARELARDLGARTIASSVHLHVTLDGDDKASGAVRFLRARFGVDSTACRFTFAFVGDSENDAPCFAAFATSIAVRNFSGRPTVLPRFITERASGAGFAEAAAQIARLRA